MQRLVAYVTEKQRARLEALSDRSGLSLSDLTRRALADYFRQAETRRRLFEGPDMQAEGEEG